MTKKQMRLFLMLLPVVLFFSFIRPGLLSADMNSYCVVPPYVQTGLPPNILIIMDNNTFSDPVGQGMQDPAYCNVDGASTQSLVICTDQYNPSTTYAGYFKSNIKYSVSSSEWVPDSSGIYSGNILNWAATSKFDLLEAVLVGGKSTSRTTNVNDLTMMGNSWQKTLKYNNNDGRGVRTCIFTVDTVKGLSVGETSYGACGYLDSPAHPFDPANGQIIAALGPGTDTRYVAVQTIRSGEEESAGVFGKMAIKAIRAVAFMMDLFASDAEAKPLAIQGGNTNLASGSQCISGYNSGTITASGGSGSGYVWSINGQTAGTNGCAAGTYPIASSNTGLCMSNTADTPAGATITGTPTFSGTKSFTLVVTDNAGHTDSKTYSITVTAATVTITASVLPSAVVGAYYQQQVYASGACISPGSGPTTWQVSAGPPSGISISPNNSQWSEPYVYVFGTPSSAGTYTFTLTVADSGGNTASHQFSLTVNAGGNLVISPGSPLPPGTVGVPYQQLISSASANCNSCAGWVWNSSGSLPPGLTLWTNSNTGYCYTNNQTYAWLTGTPTTGGTYTFTVTVSDCSGSGSVSKTFSITISGGGTNPPRASYGPGKKVCVGDYSVNCSNASTCVSYAGVSPNPCANAAYCSGSDKCILRSGIVDQFWSQARFGLVDFNKQAGNAIPNIEKCTSTDPAASSYPDSTFLSAVENAVPIDPTTTLVNAEYTGIRDYYAYADQTPGSCDPIDTQQCRKNFILMITAGVGANNPPTPSGGTPSILPNPPMPANCSAASNANLTENACFGSNVDLRNDSPAYGKNALSGNQNVFTYVVNTMGTPRDSSYDGSALPMTTGNMLYQAAAKGGGIYYGVTDATQLKAQLIQAFKDILSRAAAGTAASVLASGEGSGANLIQAVFYPKRRVNNIDLLWTGRLANYWYYVDPFFQSSNIYEDTDRDRILDLADDNKIVLNYDSTLQATMADIYPPGSTSRTLSEPFENVKSLWEAGAILWQRDVTSDKRKIFTTTDGANLLAGNFSADSVNSPDYAGTNADSSNSAALQNYLNLPSCTVGSAGCDANNDLNGDGVVDSNDAGRLINYIQGQDYSNLRSRTVTLNLCSASLTPCSTVCSVHTTTSCTADSDCPSGETCVTLDCPSGETCTNGTHVWKLSDVLDSTPKISSWIQLNAYDKVYSDSTYRNGSNGYVDSSQYTSRGMVFAGANDGMLHAFKLGTLVLNWSGQTGTQHGKLTGTNLGREIWDFIPKNALPYLKYLTRNDYCHVYTIDLTPYVFDASVGTSGCSATNYWDCTKTASTWKTILIGGMRFGGGCRNAGVACNGGGSNCVNTPLSDPSNSNRGLGYSSYFALDVTDQNNPTLLWEFNGDVCNGSGTSCPNVLGYSTTGPAIVKIQARNLSLDGTTSQADGTKNGRWFVVFGSGPTGPIDAASSQFKGASDQNLKLAIFDLVNGPYDPSARPNSTTWVVDTGIQNAFAGSMFNATMDTKADYQDDVVYVPYVKSDDGSSWTDGGVGRLITQQDLNGTDVGGSGSGSPTALNPANWVWSKVIDGIGPVTASVAKLLNTNTNQLWLFFGTGRYYYKTATTMDDPSTQRALYGVQDQCWSSTGFNSICTDSGTGNDPILSASSDLVNVTCSQCNGLTGTALTDCMAGCAVVPSDKKGWYINLDSGSGGNGAERVITDPLATSTGVVFFTTFQPYTDACSLGGKSYIWATAYNTGGAVGAILQGKALIQVSTGSIEQLDLSSAFTQQGGRKSTSLEGVPPTAQGLSIMVGPPPVKKVIHMRER